MNELTDYKDGLEEDNQALSAGLKETQFENKLLNARDKGLKQRNEDLEKTIQIVTQRQTKTYAMAMSIR